MKHFLKLKLQTFEISMNLSFAKFTLIDTKFVILLTWNLILTWESLKRTIFIFFSVLSHIGRATNSCFSKNLSLFNNKISHLFVKNSTLIAYLRNEIRKLIRSGVYQFGVWEVRM